MTYFKFIPPGTILPFAGIVIPPGWLLCDGSAVSRTVYANLFSKIEINFGHGDGSTTFNLPDLRGVFERGCDKNSNRDPDKTTRTASNPGGNTGDNVGSIQEHQFSSHNHSNSSSVTTGGESVDHNHGNTGYISHNHGHGVNGAGSHYHGTPDAYYSENYDGGGGYYGSNHGGDWDNTTMGTFQYTHSAGWHNHSVGGVSQNHYHGTGTVSAWHTHSIPFGLSLNNQGGTETRPINANINYVIKI